MASGAGLNRWGLQGGVPLLAFPNAANVTAVAGCGPAVAPYGTIGVNDSGWYSTPIGFSKVGFQLLGSTTGLSVTIYGSNDPQAYIAYDINGIVEPVGSPIVSRFPTLTTVTNTPALMTITGQINGNYTVAAVASTSWVTAPGPSDQSGTGAMANPLTSGTGGGTPIFICTFPFAAWRAVVSAAITPTGSGNVIGFGIP